MSAEDTAGIVAALIGPRQPRGSDGRYASEEPRSVAFVVRCTAEERARWKAAAGAEGLSAMVRRLLEASSASR